jgi:AcrR family transcriptional regulator
MAAAMAEFRERGYAVTSVEDVAAAAGMSRMTFYRHFRNKADLAGALFEVASGEAMPRYLRITAMAYRDRDAVLEWIGTLFAADRADRQLLWVFTQATSDEDGFTERAQELIRDLIRLLGEGIPAFALDPERPAHRRRWLEAWLLLYELLDQSNHAARASGVAGDPLVLHILADRFLGFVTADPLR